MKLLIEDSNLSFLKKEYSGIDFCMLRSNDDKSFISCLVCICENSTDVINNWRDIQNLVSVHYQPKGKLASWNIYLVFYIFDELPVWDKYEIENNRYSARKIIVDNLQEKPNSEQVITELQNQLLGSDLKLDGLKDSFEDLVLSLECYVQDTPLDTNDVSKNERALIINNIIGYLESNED